MLPVRLEITMAQVTTLFFSDILVQQRASFLLLVKGGMSDLSVLICPTLLEHEIKLAGVHCKEHRTGKKLYNLYCSSQK